MALVIALMAMTLLTGLATTVVLGTMAETAIAGTYSEAAAAFYAAEGAVEFAAGELTVAEWDAVIGGETSSLFIDGPSSGPRRLGAATIDLAEATRDINTLPGVRAAGASYRLYAYGRFDDLVASPPGTSAFYVAVWIADLTAGGEDEGAPVLGVIGRAYGPSGSRRSVGVSLTRDDAAVAGVRVGSWAEIR